MPDPVFLTPQEYSTLMRVHVKTVYRWAREGLILVERPSPRTIRIRQGMPQKIDTLTEECS